MNKKIKIILGILILVLWLSAIFVLSSFNGKESNGRSYRAIHFTIKSSLKITNKLNITHVKVDTKTDELANRLNYPLRKVAHATEYCILGIIIVLLLSNINIKNRYYITLLCCFLYACSDEFHQVFTGRTPMIKDVLIDTFGCIIGLSLYYVISRKKRVACSEKI